MKKITSMIKYCNTIDVCRRRMLLEHFDNNSLMESGVNDNCGNCDVCCNIPIPAVNISKFVYSIGKTLEMLQATKLTLIKLASAYRGRLSGLFPEAKELINELKHLASTAGDSNFLFPAPKELIDEDIERIIVHLITIGYLKEDFHTTSYARIGYIKMERKLIRWLDSYRNGSGDELYLALHVQESKKKTPNSRKKSINHAIVLNIDDENINECINVQEEPAVKKIKTAIRSSLPESVLSYVRDGDDDWEFDL